VIWRQVRIPLNDCQRLPSAELMLEIGLGKPVAAFFGGSHYERLSEA